MYFSVKLLNDKVDNSYAEIVPYQEGENVTFYVSSNNKKMKSHLETVLSQDAYVLSPGQNSKNSFSDGVVHIYPNTLYFMQALPEILSWHGYYTQYVKETHKSWRFMDSDWFAIKSVNESVYYNKQGERIVKYVPKGYVAVHNDGRVVAGGKYLNANIDKYGASWSLVENPYESATTEERSAARQYMDMSLQEYHPGVHDELYDSRNNEDDDYFTLQREFNGSGRTLAEHYDEQKPPEVKKEPLKSGKIMYSPDGGYALRSENWPPSNLSEYDKYEWYAFKDNGLSDEEKEMYAKMTGMHPLLITGLDDIPLVSTDVDLPVDDGVLFSAPESTDSMVEVNLQSRESYGIEELESPQYKQAVTEVGKKLDAIKDLTRERDMETGEVRISDRLKDMKITDLSGASARFRMEPYPYQKAGILALTETSQYEAYGGPKGWHGHYLNWTYGLGKVQPNDEIVYTPEGKKTMGEIKPNDFVMSEAGTPIKVLEVFPHVDWEFYEITFDDGSKVEAGKEHLWFTKTYKDRNNERNARRGYRQTSKSNPRGPYKRIEKDYGSVKTTEEIMNSLYQQTAQGPKLNHSIPMTLPVQFESSKTELPLDAYTLGVFLGDGSINKTMVSSTDEEVLKSLKGVNLLRVVDEKDYYFSSLKNVFNELGLTDTKSHNKFIPKNYLYASIETRVSLLQGLMDSDGHALQLSPHSKNSGRTLHSGAEYTTVSKQLAEDVQELVLGLGGKAVLSSGQGSYKNNDGERISTRQKYRLHISFPEGIGFNPFKLTRKANAFGFHKKETWNRFIIDVKPSRTSNGACILVDSENHLYLTRNYVVTHNTAVVSGANAVMRNRGHIKDGEQTTIVTAPNKNIFVWQGEVGKFLGEYAEVIDGPRETRIEQWESLLERARNNQLPPFIVVGSSKFRYVKNQDVSLDDDETWELDMDAKYMRLLASGGKTDTGAVRGKHVGAFVVDESGQYVNPDSARHSALQEIIDDVYKSNGITWTLNGDISGNSATDTISEISFVNAVVRDNYLTIANEYTKTNRDTERESKQMNRRIWKDYEKLRAFMRTHGDHIYPLDGRAVAGEDFGFKRTEDLSAPLGKDWGGVYEKAGNKMARGLSANQMKRTLGLMGLMIGASYGAVSPQRLLEYDLNSDELLSQVSERLSPRDFQELKGQLDQFYMRATEEISSGAIGRVPMKNLSLTDRNNLFKDIVSEDYRDVMENVVMGWDAPVLNQVVDEIDNEIFSHQVAGKNLKMGVAGFSKIAIKNLYNRLQQRFGSDKFLIQMVDGDTPSSEVKEIQDTHQKEKDRTVISLVTSAGLYGLSLPSDRSWRFPTWNSAKAGQYEGRFHRKAEQKNTTTVVVPDGIAQYMRDVERQKASMARQATSALIDADDSGDELQINSVGNAENLLARLSEYRPRILED